jgi:16S rRNA processing protein RimM
VTGDYTIVGRIRKPHGIHGELFVDTMCSDPGAIFAPGKSVVAGDNAGELLGGAVREMAVMRARPFKGELLVTFRDINDRNTAEEWRQRFLLVLTSQLPEPADGEVWVHELIGMCVNHVNGEHVGEVSGVDELPQGLMLEVKTARGASSVPFVDAIVVGVDREGRTLTIDPPQGLLEL